MDHISSEAEILPYNARIELAIDDIKSQKKPNYKATAKKYNIGRLALSRRHHHHHHHHHVWPRWLYEQYLEYLAGEDEFGELDSSLSTKAYWQEKVSFIYIFYTLLTIYV